MALEKWLAQNKFISAMGVSWESSLPSSFGNPVVSVSYSCVTGHLEIQVFRIISIYCGSWIQGSAGWWCWSGSGSPDVSWVGSWACGHLMVAGRWLDWVVSCVLNVIPTTFSWPDQIPRTAQIQRIAVPRNGMSWSIWLQGSWTGINEELGTFYNWSHWLLHQDGKKFNQEITDIMLFIYMNRQFKYPTIFSNHC